MRRKRLAFQRPSYRKSWLLRHPWEIIDHYWRQYRYFIQRGLYGYSDEDWWSLDWYLSAWLPGVIREYKTGMGYPANLTMKRWRVILETIAKGFEADLKIKNEALWKGKRYDKLTKQKTEGFKLFVKHYDSLWD